MASLSIFGPASGSGFSRVDQGWTFSTFGASGGFPNLPGVFAAIVSRASSAHWRMTFDFHLPKYPTWGTAQPCLMYCKAPDLLVEWPVTFMPKSSTQSLTRSDFVAGFPVSSKCPPWAPLSIVELRRTSATTCSASECFDPSGLGTSPLAPWVAPLWVPSCGMPGGGRSRVWHIPGKVPWGTLQRPWTWFFLPRRRSSSPMPWCPANSLRISVAWNASAPFESQAHSCRCWTSRSWSLPRSESPQLQQFPSTEVTLLWWRRGLLQGCTCLYSGFSFPFRHSSCHVDGAASHDCSPVAFLLLCCRVVLLTVGIVHGSHRTS